MRNNVGLAGGGSVVNWTAMPSVFPSGMAAIQDKLKLPMVMHNRQWSDKSDYVKHWTDIKWYGPDDSAEPSKFAMAVDPEQFFTKFFTTEDGWGLTMYVLVRSPTHRTSFVRVMTLTLTLALSDNASTPC